MLEIKFKKLIPAAVIPIPAHKGDAGADVVAISKVFLKELGCWEYGLGFSTEIPIGYKGVIVPRSSISKYPLLMCNSPAQIDSSYRGEWKVRFKPVVSLEEWEMERKVYQVGDRIAQIFFEPVIEYAILEAEDLTLTERSDGGFGSTGK